MKSTAKSISSIRYAVLTITFLTLNQVSNAQLSESRILDQFYLTGGMAFTKLAGDTFFDESGSRPYGGFGLKIPVNSKWLLDAGIGYAVYGGRSSFGKVGQSLRYIELPIVLRTNRMGFSLGAGLAIQYYIGSVSRHVGFQSLIVPNVYDRLPTQMGALARIDADIPLTKMFNLYLAGNVSIIPISHYNNMNIRHSGFQIGLRLQLGELGNRIEVKIEEESQYDHQFLSLKSSTVIVVLNNKEREANYYEKQGDKDKAKEIRDNANAMNHALIKAFKLRYKFAPVVFIYHQNVTTIKNDSSANVFLNDDLEIDKSIGLKTPSFFFLNPGNVYLNRNAISRQGFYYLDENSQKMPHPFPSVEKTVNNDQVNVDELVMKIQRLTLSNYNRLIEKIR